MTLDQYQTLDRRERCEMLARLLGSLASDATLTVTRTVPANRAPDSPPIPFTAVLTDPSGTSITTSHEQLEIALVDAALQLEQARRAARRQEQDDREAARAKARAVLSPRERRLLNLD